MKVGKILQAFQNASASDETSVKLRVRHATLETSSRWGGLGRWTTFNFFRTPLEWIQFQGRDQGGRLSFRFTGEFYNTIELLDLDNGRSSNGRKTGGDFWKRTSNSSVRNERPVHG